MTRLTHAVAIRLSRIHLPVTVAFALIFATLSPGDGMAAGEANLERWPEGGHIRVMNPKDVTPEEAEEIYEVLLPRMIRGYKKSGLPHLDYGARRRLNTHPYISDQHGARLVNVYTNDQAEDFFEASAESPLPVGAVITKDSISAVESGGVARGPLFIMEKMSKGFAPEFGDWRYTMIMPNGKIFGTTRGNGNAAVKFCAECHNQAADRDYLFELPEQYIAER